MTPDVLGLPLAEAQAILTAAGYTVVVVETRSRKGVNGEDRRVVRERSLPHGAVELCCAVFHTDAART